MAAVSALLDSNPTSQLLMGPASLAAAPLLAHEPEALMAQQPLLMGCSKAHLWLLAGTAAPLAEDC